MIETFKEEFTSFANLVGSVHWMLVYLLGAPHRQIEASPCFSDLARREPFLLFALTVLLRFVFLSLDSNSLFRNYIYHDYPVKMLVWCGTELVLGPFIITVLETLSQFVLYRVCAKLKIRSY